MPMPPSVTKVGKDGVTFTSNVDQVNYTIQELVRAANKEVGKYVRKIALTKAKGLRGLRRARRPYTAFSYWARKQETDLQVGIKHNTWYGVEEELGSSRMRKHAFLRDSVYDNIPTIREIQGKYLSAINSGNNGRGLIDESDAADNGGEE